MEFSKGITDCIYIAAFVSTPTSVNATLGSTATFNCSANATRVTYVWIVNGFLLSEVSGGVTTYQDEKTSFLRILARDEYNNTSVVCELTIRDSVRSTELSDPAVLRVQGMFNFCMAIIIIQSCNIFHKSPYDVGMQDMRKVTNF